MHNWCSEEVRQRKERMPSRACKLAPLLLLLLLCTLTAADFEDHFTDCHPNTPEFDACVRQGLNKIQPYYKTGLPKYNVRPFDPFFAREISAKRGSPKLGFTLILRNVNESGWTRSKVTKFKSDLANYKVVYTQSFPEKSLAGLFEFRLSIFGTAKVFRGRFTMILYDLIQTTTVVSRPGERTRAQMNVEVISNMKLRIMDLESVKSVPILENMLNNLISSTWQPGFVITRGLINELVSTAFTDIFDDAFRRFPFEQIFRPKPAAS